MVDQHVIRHLLQKKKMQHGEHYVRQQELDINLEDGRVEQQQ